MMKLRGFLLGVIFAAIAVGFAYAVPRAVDLASAPKHKTTTQSADHGKDKPKKEHPPKGGHDNKPNQDEGTPETDEVEPEEGDEGEGSNEHGKAVSTAAHCPIHGHAHGELVSSIAQDKDATAADAEAACAAALAAQEAVEGSETSHGNGNGHSEDHGKPDKVKDDKVKDDKVKDDQGDDDDQGEDEDELESEGSDDDGSGPPAHSSAGGGGKGHGKSK